MGSKRVSSGSWSHMGYLRYGEKICFSDGLSVHQWNINNNSSILMILDSNHTDGISNKHSKFGGVGLMLS